jgi:peptide/nickel transport system substrate-binding protein
MSMKRFGSLVLLVTVCLAVAACGGSSKPSTSGGGGGGGTTTPAAPTAANTGKIGGKLVVDNVYGGTWPCGFNPYNSSVLGPGITFAFIYEPLMFINILKSTAPPVPMLATSYTWSNGFKTLTFTIRSGVNWSDGTGFSAKDVAYTFNAMKSDKAIDLNALWSADGGPLTSVAMSGSDKVVFTFDKSSQPYLYYVADQTPIIPQHIWGSLNQSKLHTYSDSKPVGTGPYLMSNCTPQNIKYLRNPHYWKSSSSHPVPQIAEVDYPAFLSNTPGNLFLAQGQAQWGGQYIPNVNSFYVGKDPAHRHIWFPPVLNVALVPNLSNSLLSQLPVRQAMAYALDRSKIAQLGEGGEQQAANQTGVVTPTFQSWADTSLTAPGYDPAKAEQILKSAGFTKNSSGIYEKNGQPLSFSIKTISGYSDWDASLQIITQQLKAVGIAVTVQDENSSPYTTDLQSGHFQLAYAGSGGPAASPGPSPYYELRGWLFSGNIGSTNYSRFKSSSADSLFNQYGGASKSQQVSIVHQIQKIMVDQIPFIPTTEGVDWYQYDTSHIGGWPTQSNPYAQPSPYSFPDNGQVLARLYPTG